jgi:beta-glucosidase
MDEPDRAGKETMPKLNTSHVWFDHTRRIEERVQSLVEAMTLREKIAQMLHKAPEIPRLGVPSYNWWNECLHGVGRAGRATVFPQSIGLAASFNVPLAGRVASATSDEARAKHHAALKLGNRGIYFGLTYWTPNINIFRDPRWGRGQETYGECPFLTARMGVAFVKGLQGNRPKYLKLVATPKHYAVHSGPEPLRHSFNAEVNLRDLRETYLPAFKATVQEAGAWSVMGAYNRTNGEPCCGSHTLLQKILRDEWGFPGYVVSDCWAIKDFHANHKVTNTPEESVAMAVKNGCDLNCGDIYPRLLEAVQQGLITEEEITVSVKRLFTARFKLGMFDPESQVPWAKIKPSIVNGSKHRKLALEAARESIVLLKNENQTLPLKKTIRNIAVVGPTGFDHGVLLGNYNGFAPELSTLFEGLVGKVDEGTQVNFTTGKNEKELSWFLADAEVIIATMGFTPEMEGEESGDMGVPDAEGGGDRLRIGLPGRQLDLLKLLHATGKTVILVLTGGSPIELNWAAEHIPAILMVWYPGEAGGRALADVLFGDYNPAGRLPLTFIKSLEDIPPFTDYAMKGRTYRFMEKEPLYRFGYGLSYTRFTYAKMEVSGVSVQGVRKSVTRNLKPETCTVSVQVTNSGACDGDEVVQVYVSRLDAKVPVPLRQLAAFQRIHLKKGEKRTVRLELARETLTAYADDGTPLGGTGRFLVSVGGGQPGDPGVPSLSKKVSIVH